MLDSGFPAPPELPPPQPWPQYGVWTGGADPDPELLQTGKLLRKKSASRTFTLAVVEVEHSSCFPPSCPEEEVPRISPLEVAGADNSSCPSSRYCRSYAVPRVAGLTDSSEVWLRKFAGRLHCLLPTRPSSPQKRRELAMPACPGRSSGQGTRPLPWLLLCQPPPQHPGEGGLRHPALP